MRLAIGTPRVTLIIAPHPDDEVIGAAGLIRRLRQRGASVRVVVVTDGAASHPNSVRWPRRRLVAARRAESRRALRRLGVTASAVRFLASPDGRADAAMCRVALDAEVRRLPRLDLVVGPILDDAHPDHRAVAAALQRISPRIRQLGYRVWPPRVPWRRRLVSLTVISAAKRSLIRVHRSQLGAVRDDPAGFCIARHELDAFARPIEHFVEVR